MSKNYTQLSLIQRYQIEALLKAGFNQKQIAFELDCHPSTVSRELKRNIAKRGRTSGFYQACNAQRKTELRHLTKPKKILFTDSMKKWVVNQLQVDKWSPEFISAIGSSTGMCPISHESIYQWIWDCKHSNRRENKIFKNLYKYLKHGKRRRKRGNRRDTRGIIKNRIS